MRQGVRAADQAPAIPGKERMRRGHEHDHEPRDPHPCTLSRPTWAEAGTPHGRRAPFYDLLPGHKHRGNGRTLGRDLSDVIGQHDGIRKTPRPEASHLRFPAPKVGAPERVGLERRDRRDGLSRPKAAPEPGRRLTAVGILPRGSSGVTGTSEWVGDRIPWRDRRLVACLPQDARTGGRLHGPAWPTTPRRRPGRGSRQARWP